MSSNWQNKAGLRYLGINSGYIPPAALPQGLLSPSQCHPVLGRAAGVSAGSVESQEKRLCHGVVSCNHSSDRCSGQHGFPCHRAPTQPVVADKGPVGPFQPG